MLCYTLLHIICFAQPLEKVNAELEYQAWLHGLLMRDLSRCYLLASCQKSKMPGTLVACTRAHVEEFNVN